MARAKKKAAHKKKATVKKAKAKALRTTTETDYGDDDLDYGAAAEAVKNTQSGNWWKMDDEKVKLSIVPFKNSTRGGRVDAFLEERRHFGVTPNHKVLPCQGDGCPLCAVANGCGAELKDKYKANTKYLYNVVLFDDPDKKVRQWRAPYQIMKDVMDVVLDRDEYPNALSLRESVVFICTKTGTGFKTRYAAKPAPRRVKLDFTGTVVDFAGRTADFAEQDDVDLDAVAAEMITS